MTYASQILKVKYASFLATIEQKIGVQLEACQTDEQRLFLLAYFENIFDGMLSSWFSYNSEEQNLPCYEMEFEGWVGKFYPREIKWHSPDIVHGNELLARRQYELHPNYPFGDAKKMYVLDFAFFHPRTDNMGGKIKVAIEVSPEKTIDSEPRKRLHQLLKEEDWLIMTFKGEDIRNADIAELIEHIYLIASDKDYHLFQATESIRSKWNLN